MANNAVAYPNPLAVLDPPKKEPRLFTLAEYLRKEENSKDLHEYYDGQIIKLPMAKGPHNFIVLNIGTELKIHFRQLNKKYRVTGAQQMVYSIKMNTSLYPDIIVVAEQPVYLNDGDDFIINPILIFEVLSRSTRRYDLTDKFTIYKTFSSLKEYVTVDTKKYHVKTNFREEPNLWREEEYSGLSESVILKSIGFDFPMSMIYDEIEIKTKK